MWEELLSREKGMEDLVDLCLASGFIPGTLGQSL